MIAMERTSKLPTLVRARAPLRIGLAGGGTDIKDFYSEHGGAVLNTTINRYAYAELMPNEKGFEAEALDAGVNQLIAHDATTEVLPSQLLLHKAVYRKIISKFNSDTPLGCRLRTYCDAPIGSGLGSSSTLVVAMLKAFVEALNLGIDDYEIAELAYTIEREDCGLAGGRQDQYSATFGGFNFIEFEHDRTIVNPLRVKNWFRCELESSLLLHFTGVSRQSADVIEDQTKAAHDPLDDRLAFLHNIKDEARAMKEAVLKCDREGIVASLNRSWYNKARTSTKVSSPVIEERIQLGQRHGAEAAKVSGAGGGGFILFMSHPSKAIQLRRALLETGGETSFCCLSDHGAQAWRIS
jgi:D-glycero-alpha-D-manno-heptose-7-phosphate kinase